MAIKAFSLSDIRNPSTSLASEFTCDLSGTQFAAASRSNLTPVLFGSFIDFIWHFFCARLSAGPGWLAVEGLDSLTLAGSRSKALNIATMIQHDSFL